MGEVSDTLTKRKKKKKGRPSLIEVQKRALKQQQLLDDRNGTGFRNPSSAATRSDRRIYNPSEEDEDEDGRRDKKQRLLHGLNLHDDRRDSSNFESNGCDLYGDAIVGTGSDVTGQKGSKATDILQMSLGPFTPLPDKKLLLFILDRVQKKDTYGVYSDPVDPEELPDYHEIIKNPMDFSTLREKLETSAYATLEQFEQDVFLICTNAMEYNSADTIYHRQARAMLELAKKDFENLRQESDGEEEPVSLSQQPKLVKRGRPPGTGLKKQPESFFIDRSVSEISADAAHTPGGDGSRFNHYGENHNGFLIDWDKEFPPSVVKAVNKYGMKNVDENRRDSYNEASICTTLEDGLKQLTPVGLNTEYGYARSLARYAVNLGPVAWRLSKRRIETVLPAGTGFGPGWVGEKTEAPPQLQKCSNDLASDHHRLHHSGRIMSQTTSVSCSMIGNIHSSDENTPAEKSGQLNNPERNGLLHGWRSVNHNLNQTQETALLPNRKLELNRFQHDLNAKLVSPNSPVSNLQAGSSQQHPDLALQL